MCKRSQLSPCIPCITCSNQLINEKIADVVMLVYDAQNEESLATVEFLKNDINTVPLQGKKPAMFIVENRSNSAANYSSLKVSMLCYC